MTFPTQSNYLRITVHKLELIQPTRLYPAREPKYFHVIRCYLYNHSLTCNYVLNVYLRTEQFPPKQFSDITVHNVILSYIRLALILTTLLEMFYTTSIFINFGFISYLWGVPIVMRSFWEPQAFPKWLTPN